MKQHPAENPMRVFLRSSIGKSCFQGIEPCERKAMEQRMRVAYLTGWNDGVEVYGNRLVDELKKLSRKAAKGGGRGKGYRGKGQPVQGVPGASQRVQRAEKRRHG